MFNHARILVLCIVIFVIIVLYLVAFEAPSTASIKEDYYISESRKKTRARREERKLKLSRAEPRNAAAVISTDTATAIKSATANDLSPSSPSASSTTFSCSSLSFRPPIHDPSFFQVRLHGGGTVPLTDIEEAALALLKLNEFGININNNHNNVIIKTQEKPLDFENEYQILFWATDGTLLNFMRWGSIVNDNDVDIGFVVLPRNIASSLLTTKKNSDDENKKAFREAAVHIKEAMTNKLKQREWYITLFFALVKIGIIEEPDDRILKNLRQPFKAVKPTRCHIRRGFMQCRHKSGVMYDFFGPENTFVGKTGFAQDEDKHIARGEVHPAIAATNTLKDLFFPLKKCKSYSREFPCPQSALKVLKSFSLDFSQDRNSKNKQQLLNEFNGCTLFTRRSKEEHDRKHIENILSTTKKLHDCGYPSLWEDRKDEECRLIMKKAGVEV